MVNYKEIENYHGYKVGTDGTVISMKGKTKIIKPYIHSNGTAEVSLRKDGKTEKHLVAHLVAEAFLPNPENLPNVIHKDKMNSNNNLDNLEWSSGMDGHFRIKC